MNFNIKRFLLFSLFVLSVAITCVCCFEKNEDDDQTADSIICTDCPATLIIRNNQSGCTLVEVYITKSGESKSSNFIEDDGIGYHKTRSFELAPGKYTLEIHSNCGVTSARDTVTLEPEEIIEAHVTSNCGDYACRGDISYFSR